MSTNYNNLDRPSVYANEAISLADLGNQGEAQIYALLALTAAVVEAGSQVSDVGPALADVARELRDGLDAIARAIRP